MAVGAVRLSKPSNSVHFLVVVLPTKTVAILNAKRSSAPLKYSIAADTYDDDDVSFCQGIEVGQVESTAKV